MKMIPPTSIGITLLLFLAATILLCFLTGNTRRSYPALSPSDSTVLSGKTIALEQVAAAFQPELLQRAGDYSPPALTMWWEAIDAGEDLTLVYHPVWQDERHPSPLLHWIYYAYRAIVYGVPVRDIEYIQVNIRQADGLIQKVRYESSTAAAYGQPIAEHIMISIDRGGEQYKETALLPNGDFQTRPVRISGPRLRFGISTWSHQFVLLEAEDDSYSVPVIMPLEPLTEENYRKHKLARRSQGDFATEEGILGKTAKTIVRTVMLGVPYLLSQLGHASPFR